MDSNLTKLIDSARELGVAEVVRLVVNGELPADLTLRELVKILSKNATGKTG